VNVRNDEDVVVARLQALAPHLDGEPDPAFRAATRSRLVAMAAVRTPEPARVSPLRRLLAHGPADAALPRWRSRLTAGLTGAALTVTALAGLVALAAGAQPGDALYDLKRGTEQTQLALASDANRGEILLDLAGTRLEELRGLVDDGTAALPAAAGAGGSGPPAVLAAGADPQLVIATLDTMDAQSTEGAALLGGRSVATGRPGPLADLTGWAAEQSAGLAALRPGVPSAAQDEVDASLVLLSDITARATGLQTALACASGPATSGTDALGPVPADCVVEQTPAPPGGGATGTPAPPVATDSAQGPSPQVPAPGGPPAPGLPASPGGGGGGGLPPLPTLPVPLPTTTATNPSGGAPQAPPSVDIKVCVPPLVTLGNC
jgi:hypothetical protein